MQQTLYSAIEIEAKIVRHGARIIVSSASMQATAQSAEAVRDSLAKKQIVYGSWEMRIQK